MSDVGVPELIGDWTPRKREPVQLPDNLPREIARLVWHLEDIGCVRSPFLFHHDCLDIVEVRAYDMCPRCRALLPYRMRAVSRQVESRSG